MLKIADSDHKSLITSTKIPYFCVTQKIYFIQMKIVMLLAEFFEYAIFSILDQLKFNKLFTNQNLQKNENDDKITTSLTHKIKEV